MKEAGSTRYEIRGTKYEVRGRRWEERGGFVHSVCSGAPAAFVRPPGRLYGVLGLFGKAGGEEMKFFVKVAYHFFLCTAKAVKAFPNYVLFAGTFKFWSGYLIPFCRI